MLFVVAGAAAYPLSWGRWRCVSYIGEDWGMEARFANGRCSLTLVWNGRLPIDRGFRMVKWDDRAVRAGDLWRVGAKQIRPYSGGEVSFPLWMPAVVVLVLIWRRG